MDQLVRLLAIGAAIAMFAACNKTASDSERVEPVSSDTFTCYKRHPSGGPWRECTPSSKKKEACADVGCFKRPTAFCFQAVFKALTSERRRGQKDEVFSICTPSEKECGEWHADRQTVPNKSISPCVESRPDEFIPLEG